MKISLHCVSLVLAAIGALAAPGPTTLYSNNAYLDDGQQIQMFWNHDDDSIVIELHALAKGYVAIGFSPSGRMQGADIIVGWMKDGKGVLQDRYAEGRKKPTIDKKQDVDLFLAKEEDGYMILKFKRKMRTCDLEEDLEIRSGTMKMIWALGDVTPDKDDITYHRSRGSKNIQLIGVKKEPILLPADTVTHEFRNTNYMIKSSNAYSCRVIRMPKVNSTHHIIKFEPIIQKGNEQLVQHIVIYSCFIPIIPIDMVTAEIGKEFPCLSKNTDAKPWFWEGCTFVIMTVGRGGEPFYFPEHVGMSMGGDNDPDVMLMQIHYSSLNKLTQDIEDNSGIRIYFTPTLRQEESGILFLGKTVDSNHIVPPKYDAFKSFGLCYPKCLNEGLKEARNETLRVFAVGLHTHYLGVAVKTWQVRGGKELPAIAEDAYFDPDYQNVRTLPEERAIEKDDVIATECTYKTTDQVNATFGGMPGHKEMCISFLYYWPRVSWTKCADRLSTGSIWQFANIRNASDSIVTDPAELLGQTVNDVINNAYWSNATTRDTFQQLETYGMRTPQCQFDTALKGPIKMFENELFNFTAPNEYYEEPETGCPTENFSNSTIGPDGNNNDGAQAMKPRMFLCILIGLFTLMAAMM